MACTGHQKESPEKTATWVSKAVFFWMTRLIVNGYRRPLVYDDLFELLPCNTSRAVVTRLDTQWQKQVAKSGWKPTRAVERPREDDVLLKTSNGAAKQDKDDYIVDKHDRECQKEEPYVQIKKKKKAKKKVEPSVGRAMVTSFGAYFMLGGLFRLLYDVITFILPFLLSLLIGFITEREGDVWKGYIYALLLFVVSMARTIMQQHYWHVTNVVGMRIRTAVMGAVYRKALRLNNNARQKSTTGEIVNLMSVDGQKFQECPSFIHLAWSGPLTVIVSCFLLWQQIGPSVLAGIGVLVLMVPVNVLVAQKSRVVQGVQMAYKDDRLKLFNEVLSGIKVLKLYAWEDAFREKLDDIRWQEVKTLRTMAFMQVSTVIIWLSSPFLVALASFACYVLASPENVLSAEKAFVSLSLFNILTFPLSMLPGAIASIAQVSISAKRVNEFLMNEELDEENVRHDLDEEDVAIRIEDGLFGWTREDEQPILKDINIEVKCGSLIAIVGIVGSGKSSLISAVLGEMDVLGGAVHSGKSLAYVSQQAWIQNCSLKENIIFNNEFDEEKYQRVLSACALCDDLKILPAGDMTEIGEKGINISGGQKQRVSLARAVYQESDIYLLDDPLSAVDAHVGKHLFDQVIGPTGILKSKTRVLVTHSLSVLPHVDEILVMREGQIVEQGSYQQLLSHNGGFAQFIATYLSDFGTNNEDDEDEDIDLDEIAVSELQRKIIEIAKNEENTKLSCNGSAPQTPDLSKTNIKKMKRAKSFGSIHSMMEALDKEPDNAVGQRLTEEEVVETGSVSVSVVAAYLRAAGFISILLVAFFYLCYLAVTVAANIWLAEWTNDARAAKYDGNLPLTQLYNSTVGPLNATADSSYVFMTTPQSPAGHDHASVMYRLSIYAAFSGVQMVFVLGLAFSLAFGNVSASKTLHVNFLASVMRAPMAFFDTTPAGRLMNRVSKDLDVIDVNIPYALRTWFACLSYVFVSAFVISYTTPIFIAVIVPIAILFHFLQRFYIVSSRQLKRIESQTRSPVYSHFSETLAGGSYIRAFRQQQRFIARADHRVDDNNVAFYPSSVANRWIGVWLESLGNLVVFFAALFAVIARADLSPGLAGLSISYAMQVTFTLTILVRMTCELETFIIAVERLQQYCHCPKEAAPVIENSRPPECWPEKGRVEITNYSTRYRPELDLVLRQISAKTNPGEKIGVVGRTGAGKSSLTLALFRIVEPTSGSIVMDGIDISQIGLMDLRSRLTIIPQEPVIFSGSLRMNLDPLDLYSDEQIWSALEHAHLKDHVKDLSGGLGYTCSEGGENFSVGQRQLLCMARALLRKTKILVLDEATAAVDMATDDLIQTTIRSEFASSTVITIAHRLHTIMDYDRVIVMENGHIVEFAPPGNLLKDSRGVFYSMAHNAGLV